MRRRERRRSLLAESKATGLSRTIFLAIEEPELFQHPVQARAFATVLREITRNNGHGVQVAYATHSPYFLESDGFEQIRRMTRTMVDNGAPSVRIESATTTSVAHRLSGVLSRDQIQHQLMRVCLLSIPEALFARAVILTEGSTEQGLFEGCGLRRDPLNVHGIVVVDVHGKSNLPLAHAILTKLGVPCFVVFDGDADGAARALRAGKSPENAADTARQHKEHNRKLLTYLGTHPEDFPQTKVYDNWQTGRQRTRRLTQSRPAMSHPGHGADRSPA